MKFKAFLVAVMTLSPSIASAQTMSLIPRSAFGGYPSNFFEACNNLAAWPTVRARTSQLGSFTGDIAAADDATLRTCITNLNLAGIQFTIEAAAIQPTVAGGCGLGAC